MADLFSRSKYNPILRPDGGDWLKIYNPAAAEDEHGKIHLFPRLVGNDLKSNIGHAISEDGEHFILDRELALKPEGVSESQGVEDARISKVDGLYHMAFASFDGTDVNLLTATSSTLDGPWQRKGLAVPDFQFIASGGVRVRWEAGKPFEKRNPKGHDHRSKSGGLFPARIGGRYFLLFGEFRIWLASSVDGIKFDVIPGPFLSPRKGTRYFDNAFVEMGPPPIETEVGWLVLYHGVNEAFRYQLGFMILDYNNPEKILYRCTEPILSPQEPYEIAEGPIDVVPGAVQIAKSGSYDEQKRFTEKVHRDNIFPQVVFCAGAIVRDGVLRIYYGAADRTVCTAVASITDILKESR